MRPADGGGGGGGASIETRVEGNAASITSIATWLRDTMKPAASALGDTMYTQQSRTTSAWHGDAGEGYSAQLKTTGKMADEASGATAGAASMADTLAAGLTQVKSDMREARETATSKGLTVSGTLITMPGSPPADVPDLPAGATEAEGVEHDRKVAAVEAYNAKLDAFIALGDSVEKSQLTWSELVSGSNDSWTDQRSNLFGLLTDGVSTGFETGMGGYYGNKFAQAAKARMADATRLTGMVPEPGGLSTGVAPRALPANATAMQIAVEQARMREGVFNPRLANDLLNKAGDAKLDAAHLNRAAQLAQDGKLPPGNASRILKGGGVALAGLGTGFGIYSDIQDGESTAQAVVSNGGGLVASIAVGAAIGTAIPVPVVGTVVGALGGAVVGIVASGMIDSLWESGLDSVDDVGQAFVDGGQELLDTGEAIGDLAADVGGGIKDGAEDVFNSIF